MRIVVDTNVLVSGLLSPFGPPGVVVAQIVSGSVRLCYDGRILAEYADVLHRETFPFSEANIAALLRCDSGEWRTDLRGAHTDSAARSRG